MNMQKERKREILLELRARRISRASRAAGWLRMDNSG